MKLEEAVLFAKDRQFFSIYRDEPFNFNIFTATQFKNVNNLSGGSRYVFSTYIHKKEKSGKGEK
jgi:hypothetical protein